MKSMNDSTIFNTLIKTPALMNTIRNIDPKRDGISLNVISDAIDGINKRVNYATKPYIIKMIQDGRINIVYNPSVVKTPKYINVFGTVTRANPKPVFIIDIGRYGKGNRETEVSVNSRTLYAMLQNALILDVMQEKWPIMTNHDTLKKDGCVAYSKLASKILVKLYAIDSDKMKADTVRFMLAKFYLYFMSDLHLDNGALNAIAYKACIGGSSQTYIESMERSVATPETYSSIDNLFKSLKELPGMGSLSLRGFSENWVRMFGEGSALAIDYLPAFYSMICSTVIQGNIVKDPIIMSIAEREIVNFFNAFCKML